MQVRIPRGRLPLITLMAEPAYNPLVTLTANNLNRWTDRVRDLLYTHDLIFVPHSHIGVCAKSANPYWNVVASGQHPTMMIMAYHVTIQESLEDVIWQLEM